MNLCGYLLLSLTCMCLGLEHIYDRQRDREECVLNKKYC